MGCLSLRRVSRLFLLTIVNLVAFHHSMCDGLIFDKSGANFHTIPIQEVPFSPYVGDGGASDAFGSPLIINGEDAKTSEFPWIISIQLQEEYSPKRTHICGAVLVSPNTAVTAAHCVDYLGKDDGETYYAAVGFTRLSGPGGELIKIVKAIVHDDYDDSLAGYPHDIAMIILEKNVELSESVQIADLTESGVREWESSNCTVAGWGYNEDNVYPDELSSTQMYWLNNYECRLFYRVFQQPGLIRYNHLCLYNWPHSACYGDSGGPIVCDGRVSGLVSWATDCTGCYGIVATRTSSYVRWIQAIIDKYAVVSK